MLRELEQVFNGAMIRAIAGIVDVGEALLVHFADPDGGKVYDIEPDKSDVWLHSQCSTDDVPTGKVTSRQYIPQNMLWNLPADGEAGIVVRGKDAGAPGTSFAFYGDAGGANQVPSWLDDNNCGISHKKRVHVESTNDQVDLTGTVVNVNGTDYWLLKTDTFLSDFASNWNALIAVLQAGTQGSPAAQQLTGLPAVLTQLQQFGTNLGGAAYKSTKAKNG